MTAERVEELERELAAALRERDEARTQKDGAYAERNQCVALLARMANRIPGWGAWVARHPDLDTDWEDDWRTIVFVKLGAAGQATWHFHDSERPLLAGLPDGLNIWDGHDTAEKYRRVRAALTTGEETP